MKEMKDLTGEEYERLDKKKDKKRAESRPRRFGLFFAAQSGGPHDKRGTCKTLVLQVQPLRNARFVGRRPKNRKSRRKTNRVLRAALTIDGFSADYLMMKAIDTHKTPAEIV